MNLIIVLFRPLGVRNDVAIYIFPNFCHVKEETHGLIVYLPIFATETVLM